MKLTTEAMDVRYVLGKAYMEGIYDTEESEATKEDFSIIASINRDLFDKIPYEVVFTEDDHYMSAKDMRERVQAEGIIYIYSGGNDHPILSEHDNLIGRAVHDVFAHMVCGCPFSFQGELNAYYEQRKHYPKRVWATLFSEIPMQTATYYYMGKSYDFPQRAFRATQTQMNLVAHLKKDYSENSVLSVSELL